MKIRSLLIFILTAFTACAQPTNVNIGASAGDGTGDTLRTAFGKVNSNMQWLWSFMARVATNAEANLFFSELSSDTLTVTNAMGTNFFSGDGIRDMAGTARLELLPTLTQINDPAGQEIIGSAAVGEGVVIGSGSNPVTFASPVSSINATGNFTGTFAGSLINATNLNATALPIQSSGIVTLVTNSGKLVIGANQSQMSVATNFNLLDSMRVAEGAIDRYGVNRTKLLRSLATMSTNGPMFVELVGNGWANDSVFCGFITNLLSFKQLAGFFTTMQWGSGSVPGAFYGYFDGNYYSMISNSWYWLPETDTNWHQAYNILNTNGAISTPQKVIVSDVQLVDYIASPVSGSFVVEIRTNNAAEWPWTNIDATWITIGTINAYSATRQGVAWLWTNTAYGPVPTQIRARATSAGLTPVVEFGQWNSKLTNSVVLGQYARMNAGDWINNITNTITYPIWAAIQPTLVLSIGGADDSAYTALTNQLTYLTKGFTNSDVVDVAPHEQSVWYSQDAEALFCQSNGIPYFNGEQATFDAWGSYAWASSSSGLYVDSSHLSAAGYNYFGDMLWRWANLLKGSVPSLTTSTTASTAFYTAYLPPGTNFVLNGGGGTTNYFVIQPTNTFWISLTNVADRQKYVIEFSGMTNVFTGYYSNILFGADITGWSLTTGRCFAGFSSLSNTQGCAISFIRGGGVGY